jgi:hypothetical protein
MDVLTRFSASLCSIVSDFNNVTIHNEGVYILFPSCALQLSSLEFKFYLLYINYLKFHLPTKDERNPLKVHYNIQVCFILMVHLRTRNNFKVFSKFMLAYPAVFHFRAGSLDVLTMLLHQI